MSAEKTEAIVIRQVDFSESSRVLTLFTREFGKVSVLAKGAKRLKGPFEAALDLLTVCNIVFLRKTSASLDILTEAQLVKRFKAQEGRLDAIYAGYYLAELLDGLTEDYDPHPALYDEARRSLERFPESERLPSAVLRFELALLHEIGQLPTFEHCVTCGAEISAEGSYGFRTGQGGVICPECQTEEVKRRLQGGTLAVLRCLLSESESAWNRVVVSPQQLGELRNIVNSAIAHALGRRPRMLAYLKFSA